MRCLSLLLVVLAVLACSGAPDAPLAASTPSVDRVAALRGIADRGFDPAVVLIDVAGTGWCAGALLAADVVVTARRCVEIPRGDLACPAHGPQVAGPRDLTTLRILVGDDTSSAVERARGREVLLPPGDTLCRDDLALLLLTQPIEDVTPFLPSPIGAARGDHVRSVSVTARAKTVRDHVPVAATSDREMVLDEAPCAGEPGGAVIDETTGQLLGLLSRGEPGCAADPGWDVATRLDVFFSLVVRALAAGHMSHQTHMAKEKKGPVDMGASCAQASDCAAGDCVTYEGAQYCTRDCSPTDRCPAKYRCMSTRQSTRVCVAE
ncbi:MAG TPA: trypsin-like serine protease [Polyangiaceae bacterium]